MKLTFLAIKRSLVKLFPRFLTNQLVLKITGKRRYVVIAMVLMAVAGWYLSSPTAPLESPP